MRRLSICAKCSDAFSATLTDHYGNVVAEHNGYVPEFMPGDHFGDYVELDIDADTGQILNWTVPNAGDLTDV